MAALFFFKTTHCTNMYDRNEMRSLNIHFLLPQAVPSGSQQRSSLGKFCKVPIATWSALYPFRGEGGVGVSLVVGPSQTATDTTTPEYRWRTMVGSLSDHPFANPIDGMRV